MAVTSGASVPEVTAAAGAGDEKWISEKHRHIANDLYAVAISAGFSFPYARMRIPDLPGGTARLLFIREDLPDEEVAEIIATERATPGALFEGGGTWTIPVTYRTEDRDCLLDLPDDPAEVERAEDEPG